SGWKTGAVQWLREWNAWGPLSPSCAGVASAACIPDGMHSISRERLLDKRKVLLKMTVLCLHTSSLCAGCPGSAERATGPGGCRRTVDLGLARAGHQKREPLLLVT